jgi:3-hydroxyacyl-[acyl-carrier-protein] dehydratase
MIKNENRLTLPIQNLETIKKLIPHRKPIIMVDGLIYFEDAKAETTLHILESNLFLENSVFLETGLIEHMAQSAALYTGYKNYNSQEDPKEGFIASVKFFKLEQLPLIHQTISTHVTVTYESEQMSMMKFESYCDKVLLATAEMSTVLKP